jgi:Putative beta-barrel porin 2
MVATNAPAANWEFAPRLEGGYRYNDNYRMNQPGGELEVSGAEGDVRLTLRTVDPRTNFEITPRVRATYFPGEGDEDSTDYFLRGVFTDVTPRRSTGVQLDLSHQDVVRSELPGTEFEGDLGDPQGVDSGRTVNHNRRDLIRVAPYFTYDFTQRVRTELAARYVDAQYDRQVTNAQQDFSELGVSAGLGFQVSQRNSIMVRALASQYETSFDTDGYGGDVRWTTDFSPTARMYISVGAQQTEPENADAETTVIGGLGGRWTSQRNALFLDLTRTVGAVASGSVIERHQLRLKIDHDVSPRFSMLFGARAARDEEIHVGGQPTREYATAEAGFEWRWQRFLALTATYNYLWQEYEDEPSDASANGFLIGLVYEPKRRD